MVTEYTDCGCPATTSPQTNLNTDYKTLVVAGVETTTTTHSISTLYAGPAGIVEVSDGLTTTITSTIRVTQTPITLNQVDYLTITTGSAQTTTQLSIIEMPTIAATSQINGGAQVAAQSGQSSSTQAGAQVGAQGQSALGDTTETVRVTSHSTTTTTSYSPLSTSSSIATQPQSGSSSSTVTTSSTSLTSTAPSSSNQALSSMTTTTRSTSSSSISSSSSSMPSSLSTSTTIPASTTSTSIASSTIPGLVAILPTANVIPVMQLKDQVNTWPSPTSTTTVRTTVTAT